MQYNSIPMEYEDYVYTSTLSNDKYLRKWHSLRNIQYKDIYALINIMMISHIPGIKTPLNNNQGYRR